MSVTDKLAELRRTWSNEPDRLGGPLQLIAAIEALRAELIEARGRLTGALGPGAHIDIALMEVIERHVDQRITAAAPMLGEK